MNPATGRLLAQAPAVTPDQLDEVFAAAQAANQSWRLDDGARREILRTAADAIEASIERLAPTLTAEQGKPLNDARIEIGGAAFWLRYYADLDLPREIIRDDAERFEGGAAPSAGRRYRHHPVEFPDTPGDVEDRAGAARGEHGRTQALAVHPIDEPRARRGATRRVARRCFQRRRRTRPARCRDGVASDATEG